MQGAGTDEACLVEILSSRTNAEIQEINQIYKAGERENIVIIMFYSWLSAQVCVL